MTLPAITIDAHGIPAYMLNAARQVDADVQQAVYRAGARLRTKVRANASGRPGPRAPTGNYRRSIALTLSHTPDGAALALVSTNMPQGPRLEYGFVGRDVLGRYYNQPPYPHFGPAAREVPDYLRKEVDRAIRVALTSGKWGTT